MKQFFSTHMRLVIAIVVIIIAGGAVWYIFSSTEPTLGSYTVSSGNVVSTVDLPGTVSSSNSVDLSFQESGQIAQVYVKEGDSVTAGEALASLDSSSQQTQLNQQEAALAAAQAQLDKLQAGTRPQELAVYQQEYDDASTALTVAMNNAYLQTQDAIINKADSLFMNGNSADPVLNVPDQSLLDKYNIDSQRTALGGILADWQSSLSGISTSTSALESAATTTQNAIAMAQSFLTHLSTIVGNLNVNNSGLAQAQIDTDTSAVNAASQEVTGAADTETSAAGAWNSAAASLTLEQAGSQSQDVQAQQAAVLQAQAQINAAQIAIGHTTITAPFSGIVRNVTAMPGMVVSANVPVLSIINNGILKMDAYASETDVPNVQANATTSVTLDAYGPGVTFPARVTAVDTSETILNGSPAYHVTLYFTQPDSRILAGMTGDAHVVTAEHDDVLEVPSRLVLGSAGSDFVIVQNGTKITRLPITTGIMGDDGMVEVVSGLDDGQKISDF